MKQIILILSLTTFFSSCVSNKKYAELELKHSESQNKLNICTAKLNSCLEEKAALSATATALKEQNINLIETSREITSLSAKGAQNIEKALESIKEKDLKISRMQDALTKKDSLTLAVAMSIKNIVGLTDPDIEVNVEKGVVFISIADKLLFKSGSYDITDKAKLVLEKVAKVINDKPDFECMVEGHTDDLPYNNAILLDNWDLSVKRSTSIIRVLTSSLGVKPSQLIAAGRSSYVPLVENNTPEDRAKNRRTRIVILPKIDQFYEMIEKEMKRK